MQALLRTNSTCNRDVWFLHLWKVLTFNYSPNSTLGPNSSFFSLPPQSMYLDDLHRRFVALQVCFTICLCIPAAMLYSSHFSLQNELESVKEENGIVKVFNLICSILPLVVLMLSA